MYLYDLLDEELLQSMLNEKYVRMQYHPIEPLAILNYTEKAAFDREWNPVTRACRGLIVNIESLPMRVVARPFEKFFNYEQLGPEWHAPIGPVEVTDKADGSLGILYPLPHGGWAVATRGSFTSDQAHHATRRFLDSYIDMPLYLDREVTYLFEIVYPENRIVLDYGDRDELILLGGVAIETGDTFGPAYAQAMLGWEGPVVETFEAYSWENALKLSPRPNAEGIVVFFYNTGERVKLKQEDYVALHRIIFGMTDRSIWAAIGEGQTVDDIKEPLPEEFWPWVDQVAGDLYARADQILLAIAEEFWEVKYKLGPEFTRKEFALAVQGSPNRSYLFKYLDGEPVWELVWKTLKPEAGRSMVDTEDDDA